MIRICDLSKQFVQAGAFGRGKLRVQAVNKLNFTAADGCITGLLGANGAGKTTALRIVAGLLQADGGSATVDGLDSATNPRGVVARLGCLSDARGLYPRLTAEENIVYYARLQGLSAAFAAQRAGEVGELLGIQDLLPRRTAGFSQGERMKVALGRALVHDPPNLILDEPTNGLDVVSTRRLREILRHLASPAGGGKCIVFSTHIMQEVENLCSEVTVVAAGRKVATGSVAALCAQTGSGNFEDAFVKLAFPQAEGAQQ